MVLLALSLAGIAPEAAAQMEVPQNWSLIPSGVNPGDSFRLLFVTSTTRTANTGQIGVYNTFVQNAANAGHKDIRPFSSQFRVLGSAGSVNVRDNTLTRSTDDSGGVPIYWVNGPKVADDYADLYDGSWDNQNLSDSRTETGAVNTVGEVATGTESNGQTSQASLGAIQVKQGRLQSGSSPFAVGNTGRNTPKPFYALSPVLTVDLLLRPPSPVLPSGLTVGDQFRVLFVTSTTRDATLTDIADYNSFVQGLVAAGHTDIRPFSSQFRVVGSTASVGAKNNTDTTGTGVPIYWLTGDKVADDYADFYDGSWDSRSARDEDGNAVTTQIGEIFTGTLNNGDPHPFFLGADPNNSHLVASGSLASAGDNPLTYNNSLGTTARRFYGLSPVLTVGAVVPPTVTVRAVPSSRIINEGGSFWFAFNFDRPASEKIELQCEVDRDTSTRTIIVGVQVSKGRGTTRTNPVRTQTYSTHNNVHAPGGFHEHTIRMTDPGPNHYRVGSPSTVTVRVRDNDPPPVVRIQGGTAVTEGGAATFTLTADRPSTEPLTVNLNVAESGDFVASGNEGTKTVTIKALETSATYKVQTVDDSADEASGTITATVNTGSNYSPHGTQNSAMVTVNDNDEPPPATPVVSIQGGTAVTEGGAATFTLTASPAPTSAITVNVNVSDSGDFAVSGQTGTRQVSIPTGGTASFTVTTVNDNADEPDGTITATVNTGGGYSPHNTNGSASVTVNDNDDPPVVTITAETSAVTEGNPATFTVSRAGATTTALQVVLEVSEDETGGRDFVAASDQGDQTVTIQANQSSATHEVPTEDDSVDEPNGAVTAALKTDTSYTPGSSSSASVTVNDNDNPSATPSGSGGSPGPPSPPAPDPEEQEQSPDREALEAIYDAAGGGSWTRNDNWKTDAPIDEWHGVTVEDGRVTRLDLEDNNLEGTLHQDVGELDKLRDLYVNGNSLRGAVPLTQLQGLESLEELALWGNELRGDIPDELGKRVDRAALRKIKDVNGSALADWFREDDTPFDYSGWSGVTDDNDRVTGLDLSGVGLSGELTEAVWEISELSELDLSENPDLRGEVPAGVMDGELEFLDISGSGVCAEESEELARWLESINFTDSENCGETESSGGGSGGCFLASGDVSGERAYQVAIIVLVLAAVVGAGRIARAGR